MKVTTVCITLFSFTILAFPCWMAAAESAAPPQCLSPAESRTYSVSYRGFYQSVNRLWDMEGEDACRQMGEFLRKNVNPYLSPLSSSASCRELGRRDAAQDFAEEIRYECSGSPGDCLTDGSFEGRNLADTLCNLLSSGSIPTPPPIPRASARMCDTAAANACFRAYTAAVRSRSSCSAAVTATYGDAMALYDLAETGCRMTESPP